jgi:hypothetical protein
VRLDGGDGLSVVVCETDVVGQLGC